MKKLILSLLCLAGVLCVSAQQSTEQLDKLGGVYYAYPVTETVNTAPPKGYKPFYISHYSRHGSRYLIADQDYIAFLEPMRRAKADGKLTDVGEQALDLAEQVWLEAQGRGGELTPLGTRQQNQIAHRMYRAYPEVFAGDPQLSACATTVMRVAQSMDHFVEGLKEENPRLQVPREASQRNMYFLNYHSPESNRFTADDGPWRPAFRKFRQEMTQPERLMHVLFNDSAYIYNNVFDPEGLMWQLYWLTVDQQNVETPGSFYGILTPEEMFNLWQVVNYDNYVRDANCPLSGGLVVGNASNLLRNIIDKADAMIASGGNGADFRFGHDGNLMPLAAILRLEGCYGSDATGPHGACETYRNYEVSPMAGNVQIVFFRNPKGGDVLVKFLLNEREKAIPVETDTFPFYRWDDVRAYYIDVLDEYAR